MEWIIGVIVLYVLVFVPALVILSVGDRLERLQADDPEFHALLDDLCRRMGVNTL